MKNLEGGKKLHGEAVATKYHTDKYVATALVTMYTKCGRITLAKEVFDGMIHRDVFTWNCLILGYVENGESASAMELYTSMDCERNHFTYIVALKACAKLAIEKDKETSLEKGMSIHKELKEHGCESDVNVTSSLLKMYGKCGSMENAREVFDSMINKDVIAWNSLLFGYVENGESLVAIELFKSMDCEPNSLTYVAVIKACTSLKEIVFLRKGIAIHKQLKACGFESEIVVANTLLDMYGKYGDMQRACELFQRMSHKDVITWNCLISGYVENGSCSVAVERFVNMDCQPNHVTYIAALKACAGLGKTCLERGTGIHRELKERGYLSNVAVASTLLNMYGKCGSMHRAKEVFDGMSFQDTCAWSALLLGYVENGESSVALGLLASMECEWDRVICITALQACREPLCLEKGIVLHRHIKDNRLDADTMVASTLVDMYSKQGCMQVARQVFDGMIHRDVVAWNSLILGYVENGNNSVAVELFKGMDCQPDHITYVALLKALAGDLLLENGMAVHREVKEYGFECNVMVASTLLDMYGKCGYMEGAREMFDRMVHKDVVTWTSLMLGYVENGESSAALELFTSMDCQPNHVTYIAALKACAAEPEKGIAIHRHLKEIGLDMNISLGSTLVDMYSKCGSMPLARCVFDGMAHRDVVAWNCLILGYVENGESALAMDLFSSMDCEPDRFTYVSALKALAKLASEKDSDKKMCLQQGIRIHTQIKDRDILVANSLLEMYSKCGSMQRAHELFERLAHKDVVMWTSLMLGYMENGESSVAMELFTSMDCEPDCVTYIATLKACGSLSALATGELIHARVCKLGLEQDVTLANTLVDFYAKCARMSVAEHLFSSLNSPDIVSWNALIAGYTSLGDSYQVLSLAEKIKEAGSEMNGVMFTSILMACSHAGLVKECKMYFESMSEYGISPTKQHYTCMVDMLGRANMPEEALLILKNMPFEVDSVTWTSLLGACKKWNNLDVGKVAFDALLAGDTNNAAAYVLMSDIYKSCGTVT